MRVKAIILDITGTTAVLSENVGVVYLRAAKAAGLSPKSLPSSDVIFSSFRSAFKAQWKRYPCYGAGKTIPEARWWKETARSALTTALGSTLSEENLYSFQEYVYDYYGKSQAYTVYSDVMDLLKFAKDRGLLVGVLTNSSQRTIDMLPMLGIAPFVDVAASCQVIGYAKPDSKAFEHSISQLQSLKPDLRKEEIMHIGDHPLEDFQGARSAGLQALLLDRSVVTTNDQALRGGGSVSNLWQAVQVLSLKDDR